ncbi:MAG: D-alanyl-D-alanine dipeptidase [Myxococcales bacterium]|nr:D-alanyl-D-alanine dipeptidase [Myxococcales bacterium]
MHRFSFASVLLLCAAAGASSVEPLVDASSVVKGLVVDLRYATEDNFLKKKVYPDSARCLLRKSAAAKLAQAAQALSAKGFRLRVYDCYRPRSVQWEMWKILPKPGYVADPRKGSNHNRGAAVDLTLATADGGEVEMPTPFDTFSEAAHHGYQGGSEASRKNRDTLLKAMEAAGFKPNRMEWWHYDLPGAGQFPVLDQPFEAAE